jgi:hypothetical protein
MKTKKASAILSTKKIILALAVLCAIVIGGLMTVGPKLGLQSAPIEPKAVSYLQKNNLLQKGEIVTGYKSISYYNYDHAAVITNKRVFVYDKKKVFSIPLNKITMVTVKDAELGQIDVMISAQAKGVINFAVYNKSAAELMKMLKVPSHIIKSETPKKAPAKI